MQWPLYSGHLSIADIIFRSQLTLSSRTDPSIADTSNNRSYKTFLVRDLHKFSFGQCFIISFKFSSIFTILFLREFNGLFSSIKMKHCRYSPPWLTCFPVAKMSMRIGTRIELRIQLWRFLLHVKNDLFFTVWISTRHRNSILVQFFG